MVPESSKRGEVFGMICDNCKHEAECDKVELVSDDECDCFCLKAKEKK